MIDKVCQFCNKLLQNKNNKFCSRKCYWNHPKPKHTHASFQHICLICNDVFESFRKQQKLCSKKCVSKNKSICLKHDDIIKTCEVCQQAYIAWKISQRFCNKNCQYKFSRKIIVHRIIIQCSVCKKDLKRKASDEIGKHAYCSSCFKTSRIGVSPSEEHRKKISESRLRDWAEGTVYKNVCCGSTGRTVKWYDHIKPNNEVIRLQGTWEVLYAKHLDSLTINYAAHKGAIWYIRSSDLSKRVYLPDFYLIDADEYIDVKNDYILNLDISKQKFEDIKKCNPQIKITIITKKDLIKMNLLKH